MWERERERGKNKEHKGVEGIFSPFYFYMRIILEKTIMFCSKVINAVKNLLMYNNPNLKNALTVILCISSHFFRLLLDSKNYN